MGVQGHPRIHIHMGVKTRLNYMRPSQRNKTKIILNFFETQCFIELFYLELGISCLRKISEKKKKI